jgi:hypothetical protein
MKQIAFLILILLLPACSCSDGTVGTTNSPPEVTILQPDEGYTVAERVDISFEGRAEDRGTDPDELEMRWSSSLDGLLYEGLGDADGISSFTTAELSPGEHTIALRVIDSVGAAATDSISITVTGNEAPTISIVSPSLQGIYYLGYPVTLRADVSDLEDSPEDLRVTWTADASGEVLASDIVPTSSGEAVSSAALDQGNWVLVATVTDTAGQTDSDTVTISVSEANSPPTCEITAPADASSHTLGAEVEFVGSADDVDVPIDWLIVELLSNPLESLGSWVLDEAGDVSVTVTDLAAGDHVITLVVTDEVGATCLDTINLSVDAACPPGGNGSSEDCPGIDCATILDAGLSTGDGHYWIDPLASGSPYLVQCLMEPTYDGGGWTLVAVSSDDGQDNWTWDNRSYWDTDTTTFGSLVALEEDFKSQALHEVMAADLLFVHAPSGVWAAYDDVSPGGDTLEGTVTAVGEEACYEFNAGFPLTAGTLTQGGNLCSTDLYLNAQDQDGNNTCSSCTACGTSHGPVWSANNNEGCPLDDVFLASLGPRKLVPAVEVGDINDTENGGTGGQGFGWALNLNTGSSGAAENYMSVYVRSIP